MYGPKGPRTVASGAAMLVQLGLGALWSEPAAASGDGGGARLDEFLFLERCVHLRSDSALGWTRVDHYVTTW
jgi:hypothetical protein